MTGGKPTDALEVLESVSRTLNRAEVQMKAAKASAGGGCREQRPHVHTSRLL